MARKAQEIKPYPMLDLGNERIASYLQSLGREKLPSLLFTGPDGSGKEYTALEFARTLCCQREQVCVLGTGDVCDSCYQASLLENPAIQLIHPTPTQGAAEGEDGDVSDIAKVLEEKRLDIFSRYKFTKKTSIRIARARAVIQQANTRPFNSPFSVFIFADAHTMREETQNALLKVVEEPPPHAVFIFVTNNPEGILYTIRSRCQQVRFTPLRPDAIEGMLTEYYGIDGAAAARASALAHGDIRRARTLVESYDDSDREAAVAFVVNLTEEKESWAVGTALSMARGANREGVARVLQEMALLYRDMMADDPSLYVNKELASLIDKQKKKWDRSRLPRVVERIDRAREEVLVRNMNIDGALVDLFMEIRRNSQ